MIDRVIISASLISILSGCGPGGKATSQPSAPVTGTPKPADEYRRLPQENLIESKVVDRELMGKSFMPGGTLGRYEKRKRQYEMFLSRARDATGAAITLSDWRKALADSKLVPSFGGYFGKDGTDPVFVFSKGSWIAGIKGLPEKEADLQARILAARLPQ